MRCFFNKKSNEDFNHATIDEDFVKRMMNDLGVDSDESENDSEEDDIPSDDSMKVEETPKERMAGFRKFKYNVAGFFKKAVKFLHKHLPFGGKVFQYAEDFIDAYQSHLEDEVISEMNAIDFSGSGQFSSGFKKYTLKDEIVDFFKNIGFEIVSFFEDIKDNFDDWNSRGWHMPDPNEFFAPNI